MVNLYKLLIIILINTGYAFSSSEASWIFDLFKFFVNEHNNTRVNAICCWSPHVLINLKKSLDNYKQVAFIDTKIWTRNDHKIDHQLFTLIDLQCDKAFDILVEVNKTNGFTSPNRWIFLNWNSTDPKTDSILQTMSFQIDSDIILCEHDGYGTVRMIQLYKISLQNKEFQIENYGKWNVTHGFTNHRSSLIPSHRRNNLQGKILRASIVVTYPETLDHLTDFGRPTQDPLTKHTYSLNTLLCSYLNATYKIRTTKVWGSPFPNGSWTGIIRRLISKEDDMSGTGVMINTFRISLIEYVRANSPTRLAFIFRKPPLSYMRNIFSMSFQWTVWVSICILMLLSVVALRLIVMWEVRHEKEQEVIDKSVLGAAWSDVILFILGGLCQQGSETEPRGVSGRIISLIMFTSLMFLYVSYSANIVALLQSTSTDIVDVKTLLESRFKAGALDIEYSHFWLTTTTDPIRKTFYEKKIGPTGYYSMEEGVRKVRQGLFAFHSEVGPAYQQIAATFLEHEKCDLQDINGLSQTASTYSAVPKGSPYKEIFKIGWTRLEEYGLQERSFNRLYKDKLSCSSQGSNFVTVGLIDSYAAFVIWASGVATAVTIFVLEYVYRSLT